ncbi:MAG: hypothetical protein IPJ02_17585 [Chitinophagaceae bacterium]|nr:hypothetical protein [Chitinophagaceae bacterium]
MNTCRISKEVLQDAESMAAVIDAGFLLKNPVKNDEISGPGIDGDGDEYALCFWVIEPGVLSVSAIKANNFYSLNDNIASMTFSIDFS